MFKEFFDFFRIVLEYATLIQTLVISTAVVSVLSPVEKSVRSVLFAALKVAAFFWAEILMITFFGVLARYVTFFMGNNFLLGYLIGITIYAKFFCKFNRKSKWIMASSLFAVSVTTLEIAFHFSRLLDVNFSDAAKVDSMGIGKCFFMLLVVLFAVFSMKYSLREYDDLPTGIVIMIIGNNVFSGVMTFIYEMCFAPLSMSDKTHLVYSGIIFFMLYAANILTYLLTYYLYKERKNGILLQAEKLQAELNAEVIQMSEKNLEYLRQLKHDIGNQYTYASVLMENGQYDEAKGFLKKLGNASILPLFYVDTGNKSIDAILNMEVSKASTYDIKCDVTAVVPPHLPISDSELCSMITNLFDNAIEACVRYDIKEKYVRVNIHPRTEYLYLMVENPLPSDIDEKTLLKMNTSKKDAQSHGIGKQIVRRIVQSHDGYINYSIEDGKFYAEAMISIMNSDDNEIKGDHAL